MANASAYKIASRFLRVMWVPKIGDRIVLPKTEFRPQYLRGTIDAIMQGQCLISCAPGQFFMPAQLHFVPRKEDLENILVRMQTKGIGSFTFRNRRWEGIRIFTKPNGSRQYLPFEGTAAEVLTGLLASRIIDSDLNAAINDMVREVVIQQKEGMPDAIKTQGLSS